jgi:hypothetical protein
LISMVSVLRWWRIRAAARRSSMLLVGAGWSPGLRMRVLGGLAIRSRRSAVVVAAVLIQSAGAAACLPGLR